MKPNVQSKTVNILLLIHQYDTLTRADIFLSLFEAGFFKGKRLSSLPVHQDKERPEIQNSDLTKMLP